jgi:hypothetical protein
MHYFSCVSVCLPRFNADMMCCCGLSDKIFVFLFVADRNWYGGHGQAGGRAIDLFAADSKLSPRPLLKPRRPIPFTESAISSTKAVLTRQHTFTN